MNKDKLKFIDLFAGLGGFHVALRDLGYECIFASEIQDDLRELYKENHDDLDKDFVIGDIHNDDYLDKIGKFDILCAGFPCQPFSQAGKRQGLNDPKNGNHFDRIVKILIDQKDKFEEFPKYIFLENVPNLRKHDGGDTWKVIKDRLTSLGYDVGEKIFSPDQFGIPQQRKRIYILGVQGGQERQIQKKLDEIDPKGHSVEKKVSDIIVCGAQENVVLRGDTKEHIAHWNKFISMLEEAEIPVPRFPIWTTEWGANYPFEEKATLNYEYDDIKDFGGKNQGRGAFGYEFPDFSPQVVMEDHLPRYALSDRNSEFPKWKKNYIQRNRDFYEIVKHLPKFDDWFSKLKNNNWKLSHQKFEWNCGAEAAKTLEDKIIQFRPSGIRVKNKDRFPALVLTATQIPIIFDQQLRDFRYITKREAANLQSLPSKFKFPEKDASAFRAFGNAVNVDVVRAIAKEIIQH